MEYNSIQTSGYIIPKWNTNLATFCRGETRPRAQKLQRIRTKRFPSLLMGALVIIHVTVNKRVYSVTESSVLFRKLPPGEFDIRHEQIRVAAHALCFNPRHSANPKIRRAKFREPAE